MSNDPNDIFNQIYERYEEDTDLLLSRLESQYGAPYGEVIARFQEQEGGSQLIFDILDSYQEDLQKKRHHLSVLREKQRKIETIIVYISFSSAFVFLNYFLMEGVIGFPHSFLLILGLIPVFIIVLSLRHAKQAVQKYLLVKNGFPR